MNKLFNLVVLSLGLVFVSPAMAADAGKALFVFGEVSVEPAKGKAVALKKNTRLSVGDTVVTSSGGRAQLLLNDSTKIALRPDSRFQIEAFDYSPNGSADLVAAAATQAHFELLKGGFRSITGDVGKVNPAGFEVKTVVAVIGIRGTDFAGRLCLADGNCGQNTNAGLYLGVNDGGVFTRVNGQEYDVYDDQYGFTDGSRFSRLADLPANILDSGLGVSPSQSKKSGNRFSASAADPTVFSTPVGHGINTGRISNAEEPAGHEGDGNTI